MYVIFKSQIGQCECLHRVFVVHMECGHVLVCDCCVVLFVVSSSGLDDDDSKNVDSSAGETVACVIFFISVTDICC